MSVTATDLDRAAQCEAKGLRPVFRRDADTIECSLFLNRSRAEMTGVNLSPAALLERRRATGLTDVYGELAGGRVVCSLVNDLGREDASGFGSDRETALANALDGAAWLRRESR